MSDRQVKHKVVVETTPELAFEAVTKASELREWCSDEAWTEVRPGGRFEVRWNQGYRAEGKFTELDAPRRAAVTWRGSGEPGETAVEFAVEPADGGVEVSVVHRGFGSGDDWDKARAEAEKGWATGLENLKSTVETGTDLRLTRRPFMGILFDLLNAERAAKEGIAAERGIYINDTVEGSGARAAGLGKGDVIVAVGGMETPGINELTAILQARHAGDLIDVELVRGQKRETVQITLGQRSQEAVPDTAEGLAAFAAERYEETDAELKAAVEGLSEEEAGQSPAEGEWSVKQVLAHLSIVERDTQSYLAAIALDGWLDGGQENPTVIPGRLAAALAITPTLQGLLDRYLADEAETVAFLRGLPQETVAHKARFHRIGQTMTGLPGHTREHIEQIRKIVQAVREQQ
jgi:uncharacterized protein YndB with AHSA1/START domain/uncharacterized damage-inducible protein DinB